LTVADKLAGVSRGATTPRSLALQGDGVFEAPDRKCTRMEYCFAPTVTLRSQFSLWFLQPSQCPLLARRLFYPVHLYTCAYQCYLPSPISKPTCQLHLDARWQQPTGVKWNRRLFAALSQCPQVFHFSCRDRSTRQGALALHTHVCPPPPSALVY